MDESFGEALRELRRSRGMSQRELAEGVGVDLSYISKVENDRLPAPAADTIVRICDILGFEPDVLLALTKKIPSDVKDMLSGSAAAQQFAREARAMKLTDGEWEKLTKGLRRLRD